MNKKPLFSGKVAFMLYDTYGFPLDLTQNILKEKGIEVNINEFEEEMLKQKKIARESWVGSGDIKNKKIYFEIKEKIQQTEFVGYEESVCKGKILALIKDDKEVLEVKDGDEFEFFVDKTPFYAESGGQVGDIGIALLVDENGTIPLPFSSVEILDTKKPFAHYHLHKAKVESGKIKVGDFLNLAINKERRNRIRANHSSAHLLQYALRQIYGDIINQKGSYIDENKLRFDFSLNKSVSRDKILDCENIVNEIIFQNSSVDTKIMSLDDAKNIGATALFNEKYENNVRVVYIGFKNYDEKKTINKDTSIENIYNGLHILNNSSIKNYCSIELCGGTHVSKTSEIGFFKITSEESVSAGIRRIEAVTGIKALEYMNKYQNVIYEISSILKDDNVLNKVNYLLEENKKLKKNIENIKKDNLSNVTFDSETYNNINIYYSKFNENPNEIKSIVINLQNQKYKSNSIIIAVSNFENKNTLILSTSRDISDKIKVNELIKSIIGKGGGQPWFAMGGTVDFIDMSTILIKIKEKL